MSDTNSKWQPLISGSFCREIEAVIEEIAADLGSFAGQDPSGGPSLGRGDAGMALFFHYLDMSRPDTSHAQLAQHFLEKSFTEAGGADLWFDLFGGITGIGWVHEHMYGPQADDDAMEAVDAALLKLLDTDTWSEHFDLISGLAGIGVYALEHWPRGHSAEILERAVRLLAAGLEPAQVGMACFTPPRLMSPFELEKDPQGHFNVGVAHGMPPVATVLAAAAQRLGPEGAKAQAAAHEVVRWILASPLDRQGGPMFPRTVDPNGGKRPSRLAWCYGDAGVAGALLCASHALGDARLADQACDIARRAAGLAGDVCGVEDAPICHGAAGLAHIFNRFYQATGETPFRQAAERWLRMVLSYHQAGTGIGGFQARYVKGWRDEPGFLIGSMGIGLVLLAAVTDVEPAWDRALALSTPHFPASH